MGGAYDLHPPSARQMREVMCFDVTVLKTKVCRHVYDVNRVYAYVHNVARAYFPGP